MIEAVRYANQAGTAVFIKPVGAGLILSQQGDEYWDAAMAFGDIAPFVPPPPLLRIVAARKVLQAAASAGVLDALDAAAEAAKSIKPGDWLYYCREPDWAENNPKLVRIAKAAKVALAPLFDAAVSL